MTEVMSRAVIKTRTLKPLPGEITPQRINDATLPVKIEAARRAIAECTELPELLRYKSQAEGLAAAVRTMKEVGPELIKRANEMMADAWRKGGELLSAYSNVSPIHVAGNKIHGRDKSLRTKLGEQLGLRKSESTAMVRFAKAPAQSAYAATQKSRNLHTASAHLPLTIDRLKNGYGGYSDALRSILGSNSGKGLTASFSYARRVSLDQFQHLTPDERKVVKAKIVEIQELLDEMDRLCR